MVHPGVWRGISDGDDEPVIRTRVLLVGRLGVFFEAVELWLRTTPDLQVTASVRDPSWPPGQRLARVADVALVDLRLSANDVTSVATSLRATNPSIGLVALGDGDIEPRAAAVVAAGFTGWASETDTLEDVADVIRAVCRGDTRMPVALLVQAVQQLKEAGRLPLDDDRRLAALTPREREVLRFLAMGRDKDEIAARLSISRNTVRTHHQHVLTKLRVHTTLAAVTILRSAERRHPVGAPVDLVSDHRLESPA